MDHERDAALQRLDRYLTATDSPSEREAFERRLAADPTLAALVDAIRGFSQGPYWDKAAGWERTLERIAARGDRPLRIMRSSREHALASSFAWHRRFGVWLSAALVLLACVGVLALPFWRHQHRLRASSEVPAAAAAREVATGRGERAVLDFADGSRAMLGPESRLVVPAGFNRTGSGIREAYLEGEAYFQIKHDERRTLRIVTSTAVTEDLGTAFVVVAYPASAGTQVAVESGTVAIDRPTNNHSLSASSASTRLAVLHAGDVARVDTTGVATVSHTNLAGYTAWTTGAIVFDATVLRDAVHELERWYDLDIRIADDALADRRISGSFRVQSDTVMLGELADALGLRVIRHGRSVMLERLPNAVAGVR